MKIIRLIITTISFIFIFFFGLSFINLDRFISYLYGKVTIVATLEPTFSAHQKEMLMVKVQGLRRGLAISYCGKKEALDSLNLPSNITSSLKENPILDSLNINLKGDIEKDEFGRIASGIQKIGGIVEVSYPIALTEKIAQIEEEIRKLSFIIGGCFFGLSFLILLSLAIFEGLHRREEEEVLLLSGASKWSFYLARLTSSILYGLVASLLAMVLLFLAYQFFPQNPSFLLGMGLSFFSADLLISLIGLSMLLSFLVQLFVVWI
jgi:cell division protein FtsX